MSQNRMLDSGAFERYAGNEIVKIIFKVESFQAVKGVDLEVASDESVFRYIDAYIAARRAVFLENASTVSLEGQLTIGGKEFFPRFLVDAEQ